MANVTISTELVERLDDKKEISMNDIVEASAIALEVFTDEELTEEFMDKLAKFTARCTSILFMKPKKEEE